MGDKRASGLGLIINSFSMVKFLKFFFLKSRGYSNPEIYRLCCCQRKRRPKRLKKLIQMQKLKMWSWLKNFKMQTKRSINFRSRCRGS